MKSEYVDVEEIHKIGENELDRKRNILKIQTALLERLSNTFIGEGFMWMLPVITSKVTDPLWPDPGASIEKRVEFEIYGEKVRLMQSMIIHKIITCSLLYDKIFTYSPNIRIEKSERMFTGRHLYEFTQLDFEIRDFSSQDVMNFVESTLKKIFLDSDFSVLLKRKIALDGKWYKFDSDELYDEFGNDWEIKLQNQIDLPAWVVNIPREFYDFQDPETGKWDNYDLYLPGVGEVLSGSRREISYERLVYKMERDNVKKENYRILLELSKEKKLKNCAGAGIGIERLIAWISGENNIANVQIFPRLPGKITDL